MLSFFVPFLLLSFLSNALFLFLYKHERSSHLKTVKSLSECQATLKDTTDKLSTLIEQHQKLKALCELDKKQFEKKYAQLIQKAMQKPKTVEIPVIIEKPIPITDEDCQRLGGMIDEAFRLINDK